MTDVAEYINEVKRLHENALRVQEILGSIEDLEVSLQLQAVAFSDSYNVFRLLRGYKATAFFLSVSKFNGSTKFTRTVCSRTICCISLSAHFYVIYGTVMDAYGTCIEHLMPFIIRCMALSVSVEIWEVGRG